MIENLRDVKKSEFLFSNHKVLVEDNNVGRSTISEAVDLTLCPDRLSKSPVIDEHDFYARKYIISDMPLEKNIEAIVINLSEEQTRHFYSAISCLNLESKSLVNIVGKTSTPIYVFTISENYISLSIK